MFFCNAISIIRNSLLKIPDMRFLHFLLTKRTALLIIPVEPHLQNTGSCPKLWRKKFMAIACNSEPKLPLLKNVKTATLTKFSTFHQSI